MLAIGLDVDGLRFLSVEGTLMVFQYLHSNFNVIVVLSLMPIHSFSMWLFRLSDLMSLTCSNPLSKADLALSPMYFQILTFDLSLPSSHHHPCTSGTMSHKLCSSWYSSGCCSHLSSPCRASMHLCRMVSLPKCETYTGCSLCCFLFSPHI